MTQHNMTNREYFEDRARMSQWRAWDAHCSSCERLAEGRTENAINWQRTQAEQADWAIADLVRLIRGPDAWLDLKVGGYHTYTSGD